MSIKVYLTGNAVESIEGFTTKSRQSNDSDKEWNEYELPGIKLCHEKGRWHLRLHELTDPIPELVVDIVDEISFYESIPTYPERVAGIYRHESAVAEIIPEAIRSDSYIRMRIVSKNMDDLRELYLKIRVGSILPEESYEEQQISPTLWQWLKSRWPF